MMSFVGKTTSRISILALGSRGLPQRAFSSKEGAAPAAAAAAPAAPAAEGAYIKVVQNLPIVEIVMCRTKQLNAVNEGLISELRDALRWVNSERQVRAAIFRAEGKIFCSGLDLIEAQKMFGPKPGDQPNAPAMRNMELFRMMQRWHKVINMFRLSRVPTIAAIHGKCIGAGTDLVAGCDIRLCTADADFSLKQTKMAIVPDLGTLQYAKHLMGSGITRELAFTGRDFSAQEALKYGFVNHIYASEADMVQGATKLAKEIAANSPLAAQGAKYIINYAEEHSIDDSFEQMAFWNASFMKSEDLFAAISSFMTKTKPKFTNAMEPPPL